MTLILHLMKALFVLLVVAFGAVSAVATSGDWTQISYAVEVQEPSFQSINLTNAARAPPTASTDVMATGIAFAQTADLRVFDGAATTGAVYALLHSSLAPNTGASNIATAQRLADDLRLSSARSPFTPDGRLAPSAIQEGRQIIRAEDLGNPNIPAGYGKYESPTFQSPSGDFKVHYYYNPVTQDVVYDLDYKVIFNHQGNWP